MDDQVRSKLIYEEHPNYEKPPLVPLPEEQDVKQLKDLNLTSNVLIQTLVRFVLKISGFLKFYRQLKNNPEHYLKHTDMRSRALFFPVVSATLALEDDPQKTTLIDRTTSLIMACRSLYEDIHQGRLSQDRWQGRLLEMGQYFNFFSTNITIGPNGAEIYKSAKDDKILILIRNHFFLLEIKNWQDPDLAQKLKVTLHHLLNLELENGVPVGLLSAPSASIQLKIFRELKKHPENTRNLDSLKHVFVTICLEPDQLPETTEQTFLWAHRQFANRWWFSSLQLVVFGNGRSCAIGNFSTYLDGNVMMRGTSEIQSRAAQLKMPLQAKTSLAMLPLKKLNWRVSDALIRLAKRDLDNIKDQEQPATFTIHSPGRNFFKEKEISGVASFVIALQMTLRQILNKQVSIHQFVSLAQYRYMDLATAVVSTNEVKQFSEQFLQNYLYTKENFELFLKAIDSQKAAINKARSQLAFSDILTLFFLNGSTFKRIWAQIFITSLLRLLKKLHLLNLEQREVLISHPGIYPNVPLVGRPGIRLPYVTYMGLHYQVWPEKIVFTFMPGLNWQIPNEKISQLLETNLVKIKKLIEQNVD